MLFLPHAAQNKFEIAMSPDHDFSRGLVTRLSTTPLDADLEIDYIDSFMLSFCCFKQRVEANGTAYSFT